jgi:tetratricopeptide (TPR) repeat protein
VDGKTDEQLQREEAELATAGLVYAERAVELAMTDSETSRAHRAMGELYSHQITGMISGMRNGPKAKVHIELALDLTPDDPECMRAIALMYLHNPPISGGDVPRAIETFSACAALAPESDVYPVLLAMAYRKSNEPAKAREAASHALKLNPKNRDAQAILDALEAEPK